VVPPAGDAQVRSSKPDLRVIDLTVRYGAITALREVSLSVREGQIVCVLGPNGAGKSTLLETIAGLHKPDAGSINWDGTPVPAGSPERVVRKGICLVPEGRSIFGPLTVEENLRLGASALSRSDVDEGLEHAYTRFPILQQRKAQAAGTLSGGEQQQLVIARALMGHPKLVMYDEPSLGLAPKIARQIFELIKELREDGVTTVLVEQNVHAALEIADYAYVLLSGRLVREGLAHELLSEDLTHLYLGNEVGA